MLALGRSNCPKCDKPSGVIHCSSKGRIISSTCQWRICTKCGDDSRYVVVFDKNKNFFLWESRHFEV